MARQPLRTTKEMWAIRLQRDGNFHKAAWSTIDYALFQYKSEAVEYINTFQVKGEPIKVRLTIGAAMR